MLLEERTFLSQLSLTVNTLADDPSGSIPGYTTLRDAITQVNASTANHTSSTLPWTGTINLTSALPDLENNISSKGQGLEPDSPTRSPAPRRFPSSRWTSGDR